MLPSGSKDTWATLWWGSIRGCEQGLKVILSLCARLWQFAVSFFNCRSGIDVKSFLPWGPILMTSILMTSRCRYVSLTRFSEVQQGCEMELEDRREPNEHLCHVVCGMGFSPLLGFCPLLRFFFPHVGFFLWGGVPCSKWSYYVKYSVCVHVCLCCIMHNGHWTSYVVMSRVVVWLRREYLPQYVWSAIFSVQSSLYQAIEVTCTRPLFKMNTMEHAHASHCGCVFSTTRF